MKQIKLTDEDRKKAQAILDKYDLKLDYASLLQEIEDCKKKIQEKNKAIRKEKDGRKKNALELGKIKLKNRIKDINKRIEKPYQDFQKSDDSYLFTKLIGVTCCPYCNLFKISTTLKQDVNGKVLSKTTRPDIDHFESQKKAPEKQLEVTNLVPSCLVCNRDVKLKQVFTLNDHLNPYYYDFDSLMTFSLYLLNGDSYTNKDDFEICIEKRDGCDESLSILAENNVKDLKLRERYQDYKEDVVRIMENKKYYFAAKRREIEDVSGMIELWERLFPDENCDINSTERGKLKRDIIQHYVK